MPSSSSRATASDIRFCAGDRDAFRNFRVVPPDTGIVHQVNIEYLARVVFREVVDGRVTAYPDTIVGTDSHTTMVNGLGVLGWGVGGIEAEAAMLGQPMSMLIPPVLGFKLTGAMPEGATATDLVLMVTERLRKHGVVGKFVEFYGSGLANLTIADRATLGNMCPEYGATAAMFPIDEMTLDYLTLTGRGRRTGEARRGLRESAGAVPRSRHRGGRTTKRSSSTSARRAEPGGTETPSGSRCADEGQDSDSRRLAADDDGREEGQDGEGDGRRGPRPALRYRTAKTDIAMHTGAAAELDHGAVVVAAITSCTNTSNPSVMIGAGLLAKKAVERGLSPKAVGEDQPGAGIESRDRLPREGGTDRLPRHSWASISSATAARRASATADRCQTMCRAPSPKEISSCVPC